MITQTPKSIFTFKKGDAITRLQPTSAHESIFGDFGRDNSYIGDKLIFVGIANGNAYFQRTGIEKKIFGDKLVDLPLIHFQEGWDYFIEPDSLLMEDVSTTSVLPEIVIKALKKQLKQAIAIEDYELAKQIKSSLEEHGVKIEEEK